MLDPHSVDAYASASHALANANTLRDLRILAGFDAFVDRICHVVNQRAALGAEGYSRIESLAAFSKRIAHASDQSASFELVVQTTKPGGNALLCASALATLGTTLDFAGLLADPSDPSSLHPVLRPATHRFHSSSPLGPPGSTDALEFDDGKLMLGQPAALDALTTKHIFDNSPYESLLPKARALVFGNWTMHHALTDVWHHIASNVLPALEIKPRHCLVDLADIRRRTDRDILDASAALAALHEHIPVTLSLNAAETTHMLGLQSLPHKKPVSASTPGQHLQHAAHSLREKLNIHRVIVHTHRAAASSTPNEQAHCAAHCEPSPKLTTGAGDNFNAGCLVSMLLHTSESAMLALGNALASHYMRAGTPPTRKQLLAHIESITASI